VDEVPEWKEELTEVSARLYERVEEGLFALRLMVAGSMWMRENEWSMNVVQDDELDRE
jgi:hypothetical protein